jgi:flagellar export protein FliJ
MEGFAAMAFQFRFNSLLQQRRYQFDKAQSDLAEAKQAHERLKGKREYTRNLITKHQEMIEQKQAEGLKAAHYLALTEYLRTLEQQLAAVEIQLQKAAKNIEEKKCILIEKEKGVKMLETIEEKDRGIYRAALLQKEQEQADETAIFKDFAHKKNLRGG